MASERVIEPDWADLGQRYPNTLISKVRAISERADTQSIDPQLVGLEIEIDVETTNRLLRELVESGCLEAEELQLCGHCGSAANQEDQEAGICSSCEKRFDELGSPFQTREVFHLPKGRQSRDISWVVTVHGMNTDGSWQQDFSWMISRKLKYSAPVLILKYPMFRVMVLFARTQRLLVRDLGERLEAAIGHANKRSGELTPLPDVVLHSYGTLLFSRLLLEPRFKDLKFGRLILTGSIVRPDYDWAQHVRSGKIEVVVNYCGDQDWIVSLAQFAIPKSGPSGRLGFVDETVMNAKAVGFGHNTFFNKEALKANLKNGGAWDRFLTYPQNRVVGEIAMPSLKRWAPNFASTTVRVVAKILAFAGLGPLIWLAMQLISAVKAALFAK